ncbi:MAG: glycosyltransferase family 39 protein [Planctomycetaceae bacterium]
MHRRQWQFGSIGEAAICLAAIVLRTLAMNAFPGNMLDDRDNYLGLAHGIVEGAGFQNEFTGEPTAFRPPLYPLLIAAVQQIDGPRTLGILQCILGGLTAWLVFRTARGLGLGGLAFLAGLFVALDPILLQYTTFPMTESFCAFLTALLLSVIAKGWMRESSEDPLAVTDSARLSENAETISMPIGKQWLVGVLFGLCVLSRPTYWSFGVIVALVWSMRWFQSGRVVQSVPKWMLVAVAITVSPWVVRNMITLGHPILMTTHGGYTLLLGNNPMFYAEEVSQPWGTVWEDAAPERSQEAWYRETLAEITRELGDDADEVAVDRWMSRRAREHIVENPGLFARACVLRFVRFWSIVPSRPARGHVSPPLLLGIGAYNAVVFIGFLIGLIATLLRRFPREWWFPALLVAAFSITHLIYWSNARMRAPVIPGIALISALGWSQLARGRGPSRNGRTAANSTDRKA